MVGVVELAAEAAERQVAGLAEVLLDCVAGGASVGFMADLSRAEAEGFWRATIADIGAGRAHLFAAFDGERAIGTVLLQPSWKPNQPHRADVAKLLVRRDARRSGTASRLMDALEARAIELGRWLLTLDTASGSGAEDFYRRRGYVRAGEIPDYALMPDGAFCATALYYKRL
jgi:GNAT superfamily N-acetyltransferase